MKRRPACLLVTSTPAAFTLLELLVVMSVIALLGALLLPALSQAKSKARSGVCLANMHQLGLAFLLYVDDFNSVFPTAAARSAIGNQPEDWIWWQFAAGSSGLPSMRSQEGSTLAPYLGGCPTGLLRCPADRDALARESFWRSHHESELYTYSYSLNAHSVHGMASYISKDRSEIFRNKLSSVVNPSQKIMLAEEKGSVSDGPGTAFVDDGRWEPLGYPLSSRHAGKASVTFADGRAATVPPAFADESHPEHFDPSL